MDKLIKLYDYYKNLKITRSSKSKLQSDREAEFIENSNDLFDVSDYNVLDIIKRPESKEFLVMQRQKGRPGTMEAILAQRKAAPSPLVPNPDISSDASSIQSSENSASIHSRASNVRSITESLSSISVVDDTKNDPDFTLDEVAPKKKKQELIDERVVSVLDKCRISNPCAVHLFVAILEKLGLDPKGYAISCTTISNRRTALREEIYDKIKQAVPVTIPRGAVVHFDGKLMTAITGKAKVDRLAVKVTFKDIDQMIGTYL